MPIRLAEPKYTIYDGLALDANVWRITSDVLSADDFMSYVALGRKVQSYNFFRATSVSLYLTRQGAIDANRMFNLGKTHLAELDLYDKRIMLAKTGGPDHISVWAPPSVLYSSVVNFEEIEEDEEA